MSNITGVESIRCVDNHALHSDELCSKVIENTEAYTPSPTDGGDNDGTTNGTAPDATTNPPVPIETPASSSSAAGAAIGGAVAGVLLLVAIILIIIYCKNMSQQNAIPILAPAAYQNPAFQAPGIYTPPHPGQPAIYDAEAARARSISVQEQSSVTGDSIVYAIPAEAPGSAYVDDDFYASAAGAAAAAAAGDRSSSAIVYATPIEDEDTEA